MRAARLMEMIRVLAAGSRSGWPRLLELALVALLLVQLVRLIWTVLAPVGPMGEWRGRHAMIPSADARAALFRGFDPFYPAPRSGATTQNVTSLALTLFGVRVNEGSGLGSAIIAGSDGEQNSYAIGDEIVPGVTLKAVLFDHVVIDRGGAEETIFLDQSNPVTPVTPETAAKASGAGGDMDSTAFRAEDGSGPARPVAGKLTADALKAGIGFGPRMSDGRITGIIVSQKGPGFQAAGFRAGDIITQINGRPVGSADDLSVLQQALVPGARISVMVERGADVVPLAILVQGQ